MAPLIHILLVCSVPQALFVLCFQTTVGILDVMLFSYPPPQAPLSAHHTRTSAFKPQPDTSHPPPQSLRPFAAAAIIAPAMDWAYGGCLPDVGRGRNAACGDVKQRMASYCGAAQGVVFVIQGSAVLCCDVCCACTQRMHGAHADEGRLPLWVMTTMTVILTAPRTAARSCSAACQSCHAAPHCTLHAAVMRLAMCYTLWHTMAALSRRAMSPRAEAHYMPHTPSALCLCLTPCADGHTPTQRVPPSSVSPRHVPIRRPPRVCGVRGGLQRVQEGAGGSAGGAGQGHPGAGAGASAGAGAAGGAGQVRARRVMAREVRARQVMA